MNEINNEDILKKALFNGKVRGYSEEREINEVVYIYEYAIKQENSRYTTYFFFIEFDKLECIEDYGHEEHYIFDSFKKAIDFLKEKGADILLMKPLKGSAPI